MKNFSFIKILKGGECEHKPSQMKKMCFTVVAFSAMEVLMQMKLAEFILKHN